MSTTVKINGQKLDLNGSPDLHLTILIDIEDLKEWKLKADKRLYNLEKKVTNLEEYLSSVDTRLCNLEKKLDEIVSLISQFQYYIQKK